MQREEIKYLEDCVNLLTPIQHFKCLSLEKRPINITPMERPDDNGLGLIFGIIIIGIYMLLIYKNNRSIK